MFFDQSKDHQHITDEYDDVPKYYGQLEQLNEIVHEYNKRDVNENWITLEKHVNEDTLCAN